MDINLRFLDHKCVNYKWDYENLLVSFKSVLSTFFGNYLKTEFILKNVFINRTPAVKLHFATTLIYVTLPASYPVTQWSSAQCITTSYQRCVVFGDRWRRRLERQYSHQSRRQTAGARGPGRAGLSEVLADPRRLRGRRRWLYVGGWRWRLQRLVREISKVLPHRKGLINCLEPPGMSQMHCL